MGSFVICVAIREIVKGVGCCDASSSWHIVLNFDVRVGGFMIH